MTRLTIGYVARAHGVRGELRVHLHDEESETIFEVDRVWIGGEEARVKSARTTTGAALLVVEGIEDRDAAEALRGRAVEVERDAVPIEEGEFFVADLVGCEVVDESGGALGRCVEVTFNGAQDVMVIRDERVERMLPVVPEFVISVDTELRRVVVAPPEDLPAEPI
jgi:16S rRNA processing protein RimM